MTDTRPDMIGSDKQQDGKEGREDATQRLAGPQQSYNLEEIIQKIQGESEWQQNGRNQFALLHSGALRVALMGFKSGTGVENHRVNGQVAITVLQGSLDVTGEGGASQTVGTNGFFSLDGQGGFSATASEDTFALFTICQAEGVAESAKGNEQGTQITQGTGA